MSRSAKNRIVTRYTWGRALEDPTHEKAGNRRHVGGREDTALIGGAIFKRHWHGSSERIRRRNRRIFERLAGKIRRRADRDEITHQLRQAQ